MASFSASVSAWARGSKERMTAVRNIAAERVVEVMQTPVGAGGNMPVDTGFLRASLAFTTGATLPGQRLKPDVGSFSFDPGELSLKLLAAPMSETINIVYTANYARAANYGSRGRPGRQFVGLAAQQWPRIVTEACAYVKGRAGG